MVSSAHDVLMSVLQIAVFGGERPEVQLSAGGSGSGQADVGQGPRVSGAYQRVRRALELLLHPRPRQGQ